MPARLTCLPLLACLALLPGPPAQGAAPPAGTAARVDRYGDPLPGGALARLGTLRLHQALTNCVAFSPDGRVLASGGDDNKVRFWDRRTGRLLRTLGGHGGSVTCLALSRDGRWLASGGRDRVIRLWEAATGKEVRRLRGHTDLAAHLGFSPDGKLLASSCLDHRKYSSTVRVWDVATGKELRQPLGEPSGNFIDAIAFSPDGKYLAAGDTHNKVYLWDVSTWKLARTLEGHTNRVTCLAFLPGGKRLLSSSYDKTVRLWDVATGKELRRLGRAGPVLGTFALSPDGRRLAAVEDDRQLHVWDVATGKDLRRWRTATLHQLVYSPDGTALASSSHDAQRIDLWDVRTGKRLLPAPGPPGAAQHLAFSADGKSLAVAYTSPHSGPGEVWVWDTRTGKERSRAAGVGERVTALAYSPRGGLLAAAIGRDGAEVWDVPARKLLARPPGLRGAYRLALSPRGEVMAGVVGEDVVVWDRASGKEARQPKAAPRSPHALALSPDGATLAVAGEESVYLAALPGGKRLRTLGAQPGWTGLVGFSPDGRWVVTSGPGERRRGDVGSIDTDVYLWEAATGKECLRLLGHRQQVIAAAFSPGGRLLASASRGEGVRLWDLATGKPLRHLGGHHGWVNAVALSPDGRTLASAGEDSTVLLWDVERLVPAKKGPAGRLSKGRLAELWEDLGGEDAAKAYRAVWALAEHPEQAVPLLGSHLRPGPAPDPKRVAGLVKDLADDDVKVRRRAMGRLGGMGPAVAPALRRALATEKDLEIRLRLAVVLRKLTPEGLTAERRRALRALEVLEYAGTVEAGKLLGELAGGMPDAWLGEQAKAAGDRLARRRPGSR